MAVLRNIFLMLLGLVAVIFLTLRFGVRFFTHIFRDPFKTIDPEFAEAHVQMPETRSTRPDDETLPGEAQALVDEKLGLAAAGDSEDALYDKAVAIVARDRKCSTSYIQRKLAIGYNKAARLVEQMEEQGVVTSANAVAKREILIEER